MPPRMGPLMRSQAIGGPACSTVSRVIPGTTSIAGRTSIRTWWAVSMRSSVTRFASSTASHQSEARSVDTDGGRQSTRRTGTPWATRADAKRSGPTTTAPSGSRSSAASDGIASLGDRARREGGDPVARAHDGAGLAELLLLALETLGVVVGTHHVDDDRQLAPAAPSAPLGERRTQGAGRVGVGAIPEHEVQQQHGGVGVLAEGDDRGVPETWI